MPNLNWEFTQDFSADVVTQLAGDEQRLDQLAAGVEHHGTIRFWAAAQTALVVSRRDIRLPQYRQACDVMAQRRWPVYTRSSGGGVCPQGPGLFNLSVIFPEAHGPNGPSIQRSYTWFCRCLQQAFATHGMVTAVGPVAGGFCDGRFNIIANGRKLVGTAQRWKRIRGESRAVAILIHALILFNVDRAAITAAIAKFYSQAGGEMSLDERALINVTEVAGLVQPEDLAHSFAHALQSDANTTIF